MRRRQSNLAAFTLLELVLVLALITIVVAIAVPSLRLFGRGKKIENAAAQLCAVANWARAKAINDGVPYRLNLDTSNGTYYVTVQNGAEYVNPLVEFGKTYVLSDGVTASWDAIQQPDGQYVQFQPTGRCDPVNIRLVDENGSAADVVCESATELFRWYLE